MCAGRSKSAEWSVDRPPRSRRTHAAGIRWRAQSSVESPSVRGPISRIALCVPLCGPAVESSVLKRTPRRSLSKYADSELLQPTADSSNVPALSPRTTPVQRWLDVWHAAGASAPWGVVLPAAGSGADVTKHDRRGHRRATASRHASGVTGASRSTAASKRAGSMTDARSAKGVYS